jgi:TP901 family phage tail tape measure protein
VAPDGGRNPESDEALTMAVLQSSLKISVIDAATSRLRAIGSAIGALHRRGNSATMMPMAGAVGRLAAFAGAYVGVTGGIQGTVGAARDMQAQLTEIGIKADLSKGQLAQLRSQMRSLSGDTNQTTTELLGGVDAMVTLGLDADRAAAAIPAIGKAATATMSSVTDLSAASVAAMQNMKVAPGEIGKMLDAMAEAGNQGAFEMRDMAREFPALTASAKSLGIEGVQGVTDIASALQIARRGAGDAGTAANNMANFLQKIMAPATIKNFKKFGVDVTKELKKAHKQGISPIEHFIKLVDEKTDGGRADLLGQLFGDKQVLEFVRPMIADFKDYLKIRGDAERASGTVAAAYAQRMKDANQQVKSFHIQISNLGEALGETALKPLGDFAGSLAHILKTLGSRVGVFDKLKSAMEGFTGGLGLDMPEGGLSGWLERNVFGEEFKGSSRDVDERVTGLARLSNKFREIGKNVRQFAEDVAGNPIAKFLAGLVGTGFKLMLASAGISILAGALWKLGRAAAFLSGLTAVAGIVKGLAKVGGLLVGGGSIAAAASKGGGASVLGAGAKKGGGWLARWLGGRGVADLVGSGRASSGLSAFEKLGAATGVAGRLAGRLLGLPAIAGEITTRALLATPPTDPRLADPTFAPWAYRRAEDRNAGRAQAPQQVAPPQVSQPVPFSLGQMFRDLLAPVGGKDGNPADVNLIGIPQIAIPGTVTTQPSGTQDVRITNPQPAPNITVHVTATQDPQAIAAAAVAAISAKWNALSRGSFSDGAN